MKKKKRGSLKGYLFQITLAKVKSVSASTIAKEKKNDNPDTAIVTAIVSVKETRAVIASA